MSENQAAPAAQPAAAPQNIVLDEDLLSKVIQQMEEANPYGMGKYSDEDATLLGLPSLGALRLANQMVKQWIGSPFIPKWIANSPNPAGTFVATVIQGNEFGFKMMESVKALYQAPDGRLGMYGTAMISLMRRSKFQLKFSEDELGATVWGKRPDGDEYTARFTRADSARAGLVKAGSNHEKYPLVMCQWRALSILFRFLASDLSAGPIYTAEELLEDVVQATQDRLQEDNPFTVGERPAKQDEPAAAEPAKDVKQPAAEVKQDPEPVKTETEAPKPETKAPESKPEPVKAETKTAETERVRTDPPPKKAAEPGPVAVPPEDGKETLAATQNRLALIYNKKSPDAMKLVMNSFMKGFLNKTALPKPVTEAVYRPIFRILERVLEDEAEALVQDPNGLGLTVGVGYRETQKQLEEWAVSDRCKAAFFDTYLALQHTLSGGKLTCTYMEALGVDKLAEADMFAYLQVARRTPLGEVCNAYLLMEQSEATKKRVSEIVAGWGIDVDTAPIAGINALLEGGAAKPEPKTTAATAAVPETLAAGTDGDEPTEESEEIDEVLSLFDMTDEN